MAVYLGQNEVILRNGISTTDADATAADILVGKTAYVNDIKIIGTNFILVKKDVNFYDYDGTLVAGYTVVEAQALSALPTAPTHTDLTFQEWNYTLAQVNATTLPLDVGATYITTDGKSHFHITLTAVSGLSPTFYFNKSDTSELTIDYGDGTTETSTISGNINFAHTYATAGNYVVKTWISSGSGTYGFGNGSNTTVVVGGGTSGYRQTLTKCFVGTNVLSMGMYSFASCSALTSITIPSFVTSIGDSVFQNCYSLASVTIPSSVASIGVGVFTGCYSLTSVVIPSSVTSIGAGDFYNCRALASVTIPSSVASIGANAFNSCYSLTSVVIPSFVTSIGDSVFQNCYSLASVVIPSSVTSISASVFASCSAITSVVIPSSVTSIGNNAFQNCLTISCYIVEAASPPALASSMAFFGILSSCKIKVPSASLTAYQTATNWSTYANYMEGY